MPNNRAILVKKLTIPTCPLALTITQEIYPEPAPQPPTSPRTVSTPWRAPTTTATQPPAVVSFSAPQSSPTTATTITPESGATNPAAARNSATVTWEQAPTTLSAHPATSPPFATMTRGSTGATCDTWI